jgi:hypothetical protein
MESVHLYKVPLAAVAFAMFRVLTVAVVTSGIGMHGARWGHVSSPPCCTGGAHAALDGRSAPPHELLRWYPRRIEYGPFEHGAPPLALRVEGLCFVRRVAGRTRMHRSKWWRAAAREHSNGGEGQARQWFFFF